MVITPTADEINELATKLDQLSSGLTAREHAILLSIFGIAGRTLAGLGTEAKQPEPAASALPKLSDGFKATFQAGPSGKYEPAAVPDLRSISVGGECITWTN